jgi:hypothetical protein
MGTDVHAYLEFAYGDEDIRDAKYTWCMADLHMSRDYEMFDLMAGGRSGSESAIVRPRGVPKNISYMAEVAYYLYVDDKFAKEETFCSTEEAKGWVKSGCSKWSKDKTKVSHPDWHNATWLTLAEYRKCLEKRKSMLAEGTKLHPEYEAVLATMEALKKSGNMPRLTLWFDN